VCRGDIEMERVYIGPDHLFPRERYRLEEVYAFSFEKGELGARKAVEEGASGS
jgi:hypothetical protein